MNYNYTSNNYDGINSINNNDDKFYMNIEEESDMNNLLDNNEKQSILIRNIFSPKIRARGIKDEEDDYQNKYRSEYQYQTNAISNNKEHFDKIDNDNESDMLDFSCSGKNSNINVNNKFISSVDEIEKIYEMHNKNNNEFYEDDIFSNNQSNSQSNNRNNNYTDSYTKTENLNDFSTNSVRNYKNNLINNDHQNSSNYITINNNNTTNNNYNKIENKNKIIFATYKAGDLRDIQDEQIMIKEKVNNRKRTILHNLKSSNNNNNNSINNNSLILKSSQSLMQKSTQSLTNTTSKKDSTNAFNTYKENNDDRIKTSMSTNLSRKEYVRMRNKLAARKCRSLKETELSRSLALIKALKEEIVYKDKYIQSIEEELSQYKNKNNFSIGSRNTINQYNFGLQGNYVCSKCLGVIFTLAIVAVVIIGIVTNSISINNIFNNNTYNKGFNNDIKKNNNHNNDIPFKRDFDINNNNNSKRDSSNKQDDFMGKLRDIKIPKPSEYSYSSADTNNSNDSTLSLDIPIKNNDDELKIADIKDKDINMNYNSTVFSDNKSITSNY